MDNTHRTDQEKTPDSFPESGVIRLSAVLRLPRTALIPQNKRNHPYEEKPVPVRFPHSRGCSVRFPHNRP